ncbi:MAG: SRPBCC domain-containing protein [Chloroflexota bacterium]
MTASDATPDPIRLSFEVACSAARAFELWTARTSMWWPASHTVTAAPGLEVVFEGGDGGRIFERAPDGTEHDWGWITRWQPPGRLVYRWHLRSDRADATEVEIRFTDLGKGRARVDIEHRGWELLGSAGPARREGNLAGWGSLLPHFVAAAREAA